MIELNLVHAVLLEATAAGIEDPPPRRHRLTVEYEACAEGPEIAVTGGQWFIQPMLRRGEPVASINETSTLASLGLPWLIST